MIESFKHKGLKQLFEDDNARGVSTEHVRKIRQILAVLHSAETIEALRLPTFGLHALKGDLKGWWGRDDPSELADYFPVRGRQRWRCRPCGLSLRAKAWIRTWR
jgi:RelE-like toxin of type II toxin-antitoxin system HigB